MLKSLYIKNIALIKELNIEFDKGLNVLTGETGAGKSIIIDSLNFVLGARSDKTLIRSGELTASVDALFDISENINLKNKLNNFGINSEDELLITRTMNIEGRSDAKVNGRTITVAMLKEITSLLVDIYGQQEQVGLLKNSTQMKIVDNFAGKDLKQILSLYQSKLSHLKDVNNELLKYSGNFDNIEREKDYLNFVIDEITTANISKDEEDELIALKQKMGNYEKIISSTTTMQNSLNESLYLISQSVADISSVVKYDENLALLKDRLESSKIEIDDVLSEITNYNRECDFDERKFDEIDSRLDFYKSLKRKYGNTVDDILDFLNKAQAKLDDLNNSEKTINNLTNEKNNLLKELFDYSMKLDKLRKNSADILSKNLLKELSDLGMPNAKFVFDFDNLDLVENNLSSYGVNQLTMLFSANLGQELKPLNKVASGGELSRVMLAFKTVVSNFDEMPTMIFDEIDAGISGKMSQVVSEKIANISRKHQVLVITHSAQIAAIADTNFIVQKYEIDGNTISKTHKLTNEEKIDEIARFISVDGTMELSKQSASALIDAQNEYKKNLS